MDQTLSSSSRNLAKPSSLSIQTKSINLEKPSQTRNYSEHLAAAGDSTSPVPTPVVRARSSDVYVGYNRRAPSLSTRLVKWLTAELEMLGVSVLTIDRNRNRHAISHCAAKVAMEVVPVGIVVVTVPSLSDAFSTEEMLLFSRSKKLVPIFVGLTRDDCVPLDVIQGKGDLWSRFGGELWRNYGGREEDWIEAVDGLSRADVDFEASAANLRDCTFDVVAFIGKRLGKRSIVESIQKWRESGMNDLPFPRNEGFIGRKKELRQLEFLLFGYIEGNGEEELTDLQKEEKGKGKKPMAMTSEEVGEEEEIWFTNAEMRSYDRGVVCVTGETGLGKTELLLEFAYQHSQRYKAVWWVGGEARFLRENYMKLSGPLGIEVGIDNGSGISIDIEAEAIGKVRKELIRDVPYLIVIDNLEMEKDFWDGRPVSDLLPAFTDQTHVIISTRLPRVLNTMPFRLAYPSASEAMALMKGDSSLLLTDEDGDAVLEIIQKKLRRVPFGLVLVRAIVTQLPITLSDLLESTSGLFAEISHSPKEDPIFQHNNFLVQILDVCFNQFFNKNLALKIVEVSSWFGPSPVPVGMLANASWEEVGTSSASIWKKLRNRMFPFPCMAELNAESKEAEALSMLMRLGIARRAARPGHVHFHDIFKLYVRKRSDTEPSISFVKAIFDEGFLPEYADHAWAASFMVLKFGMYHPIPVDLTPRDLLLFIRCLVTPLVTYCLNELSLCSAVLEILRVSIQRLELLENSVINEAEVVRKNKFLFGRKSQPLIESDPSIHRDIATLRAEVLETRAKIMIKTGKYDVAEDLCRTSINIKEVIYGVEHDETQSVQKIIDLIATVKSRF